MEGGKVSQWRKNFFVKTARKAISRKVWVARKGKEVKKGIETKKRSFAFFLQFLLSPFLMLDFFLFLKHLFTLLFILELGFYQAYPFFFGTLHLPLPFSYKCISFFLTPFLPLFLSFSLPLSCSSTPASASSLIHQEDHRSLFLLPGNGTSMSKK